MSHTTVECSSCGGSIEPGDRRKASDEGPKHDFCVLHESLFDEYRFYITNPSSQDGYSFGLWRVYGESEFPVVEHSEGLTTVQCSSSMYSGSSSIEPTEDFFTTVAYTVHSLLSYNPFPIPTGGIDEERVRDEVSRHIDIFYPNDGHSVPYHEEVAIEALVFQLIPQTFPYVIPELEPIRDFSNECTGFKVPPVHEGLKETSFGC